MTSVRLLIVDDDPEDREAVMRQLGRSPVAAFEIAEAKDGDSCLAALEAPGPRFDCILLDFSLPWRNGLAVLSQILTCDPHATVIMLTGMGNEEIAVEALKRGARDYLVKGHALPDDLDRRILGIVERAELARQVALQRESLRVFADVLVHDLRSPLNTIRDAIDLLVSDPPQHMTKMQSELLGFVVNSADHMDRLMLSLSEMSEVDRADRNFETFSLVRVLQDVRASLDSEISRTGAILTYSSPLLDLVGSPGLIALLLQNLIANGIKYNRSERPQIDIHATDTESHVTISVRDNGIGIAPEHQDTIFEPFKRLHRRDEFDGCGLGLATCRRVAERHGGQLTCTSEPGKGSVFSLTLPREPADAAEDVQPSLRRFS